MKLAPTLAVFGIVFIAGCVGQSATTGRISEDLSIQSSQVKEFDAAIRGYQYEPVSIDVNLGDRVKVNIRNDDLVTHGISLPMFGVSTNVRPGATRTIEFTADRAGNPETFCSTDHGEKLLINVN